MSCGCDDKSPSKDSQYKTETKKKTLLESVNPVASAELRYRRNSICRSCTLYDNTDEVPRCKDCGCPIATRIFWTGTSCPLGKW